MGRQTGDSESRSRSVRIVLVPLALLLLLFLLTASNTWSNANAVVPYAEVAPTEHPAPRTPIKHIVIVMQENHAFNNFFGMFPGLVPPYSENLTVCEPYNISDPSKGCVKPFNADNISAYFQSYGVGHGFPQANAAYDGGKMDGFVYAQTLLKKIFANYSMGYFTNATLPDYWDLASYYGLDANFFSSAFQYSWPNHIFAVAARMPSQCYGQKCLLSTNLTFPTIVTELNQTRIDWRYYTGQFNDSYQCKPVTTKELNSKYFQPYFNVLPDFPAIQLSKSTCHRIENDKDFFRDVARGYLPQVSWVEPNYTVSDHPGTSATLPRGQLYVSSIVDSIASNSTLWNSTAIFVTWDDFGGYFDGIKPTQVDGAGYGFRVPLLVISPYVVPHSIFYGYPTGTQEDFSAFLSTIEYNWNLKNLTDRDGADAPLFYMLNFSQKPLPPLMLPSNILASYPWQTCSFCKVGFGLEPTRVSNPPYYPSSMPAPPDYNATQAQEEGDPYD